MTVPSDPNLTRQPGTLDPAVKLPDEPPHAMGHDEDRAGEFADVLEAHKDAVEESEGSNVGPRVPGDHAGSDDTDDTPEDGESDDDSPAPFAPRDDVGPDPDGDDGSSSDDCVPNGTIEEVKAWVGDDHERAQQALQAERDGQNRSTLVTYLEAI